MSVWVEIKIDFHTFCRVDVTLHVSVWVEICVVWVRGLAAPVTLHVSVWVEIEKEYKSLMCSYSHAPRERVSWNCSILTSLWSCSVTLHVSVWVEISFRKWKQRTVSSRSTWACELKFSNRSFGIYTPSHAPRERVSWNERRSQHQENMQVTLHVSVWVEITISGTPTPTIRSRSTWACELKSQCP